MYFKNFYKNLGESEVKKKIKEEGFEPVKIVNSPGDIYSQHSHPETKLLAILKGSMVVKVEEQTYMLKSGDKLVIPSEMTHSAVVGEEGCTFFWAEKLLLN